MFTEIFFAKIYVSYVSQTAAFLTLHKLPLLVIEYSVMSSKKVEIKLKIHFNVSEIVVSVELLLVCAACETL